MPDLLIELPDTPVVRRSPVILVVAPEFPERHYAPWTRSRQEQIEADLKAAWSNDPVVLTDAKGTPEMQGKTGQVN